MSGEHLYTVFLVLVVVCSVRFLVRFQIAEWRHRSAKVDGVGGAEYERHRLADGGREPQAQQLLVGPVVSAAPTLPVERLARPAPTVTRLTVRGRAEAIADWATQHPEGCVCTACLEAFDAELMALLREGGR